MDSGPRGNVKILALETSGRQGGVAVAHGSDLLAAEAFSTDRNHAVELLPVVDRLTRQVGWTPADLDEVHVSAGPGSFTGLRVGIAFARALALAVGVRIVRVPTVEVLARNALALTPRPPHLAVLLDAKRQRVYAATFTLRGDRYEIVTPAAEADPVALLAAAPRPLAVLGEGVPHHRSAVDAAGVALLPEASWPARAEAVLAVGGELATRGAYTAARDLVPIYIRRPEAEEKWERRQTGA
jgi:tRNA threonylcarbamoyladenosine biosynthesis protein TsaB